MSRRFALAFSILCSISAARAEEIVIDFEQAEIGKPMPTWTEKGVVFKLAGPLAHSQAVGRIMFDRTTGLFAAALLAIMPWHLHLSRIAFLVNSWPFIEMAILWVLFRVRRQPTIWGYAAVGALVGLGVYTYNAYALFVPVAAVPFLYDLVAARDRRARRAWLVRSGAALLTALWAASFMAQYAARHEEYYWHHRDVSVFNAKAWKEADWPGRANIFVTRAADWATGVVLGGRPDHGDALGERDHPLIDPLTTAAAAVGVLMALAGLRRVACGVLIAAVLVLPWGALLTVDDGLYRRTLGLVPFIALLAALPLAWLWKRAQAWGGVARLALGSTLAMAIGAVALRNVSDYFGPLQSGPEVSRIFPYQVDAAARAIARLPPETVVYLYSDRWGGRFETVRWWAPDTAIVDGSREYRERREPDTPIDFSAQPSRPTAFVLLGNYLPFIDQLRIRYPGADVQEESRNSEVLYRIVLVRPS
jgi:hypothetical protein